MEIEEEFQAVVRMRGSLDGAEFLMQQSPGCLRVMRSCGITVDQPSPVEIKVCCPNKASLRSVKSEGVNSSGYSVSYWVKG